MEKKNCYWKNEVENINHRANVNFQDDVTPTILFSDIFTATYVQ